MNYKQNLLALKKDTSINDDVIFDFSESPLEETCNIFVDGFAKILDSTQKWGIKKCYFYISEERYPNANANVDENGIGIIKIHIGLVNMWKDLFLENILKNKSSDLQKKLEYIEINYKINISKLFFEIATQYILYHELAHIIQLSHLKIKNNYINELYSLPKIIKTNTLLSHCLEIDADIFSALSISDNIIPNFLHKMIQENNIHEQFMRDIISFAVASSFLTILTFSNPKKEIYFCKHTHPHPSIRNIVIMKYLVYQLLGYCESKNKKFNITEEQIIENVFMLAADFFNLNIEIEQIKTINSKTKETDIENYINLILKQISKNQSMATVKREALIKNNSI